jgi:hypothetical protein
MLMKIADHISKKKREQLAKLHSPKSNNQHKKKTKKTEKINWHELMGSNNRGLVRGKGGALKRK